MIKERDSKGKYFKGRDFKSTPIEDRIKRMYSSELAWKSREDYIADIVSLNPYIYNSWRSFKFTQKGKKSGNSKEWDNFRTFYNDVVLTYKKGLVFRRLDNTKPYSKNNFIWVTTTEAAMLNSDLVWIEYRGKTLTLKEWANELVLNYQGVRSRYHRRIKQQYTTEEIFFGRPKKKGSKTPKDYRQSNIRAKASKMISTYKNKDKKNSTKICDISIDWMIENIFKKECTYCQSKINIGCDRIDNLKGHTKDNVLPACVTCNTARGNNFSVEEMKLIGKTIKVIKDARNKTK